jgi:hypothetical protein
MANKEVLAWLWVLSLLLAGVGSKASLAQQGFEKTSVNAPPSLLWFLGVAEQNTIKPGVRLWVRAIMRIAGGIRNRFTSSGKRVIWIMAGLLGSK